MPGLNNAGISTVVVHPLVLLSTVDHFSRAGGGPRKRVVGVLLGDVSKGVVNVTNSFAVPFDEDDKHAGTWFLDHDFLEQMYEMFRKVAAKEKIVGWYSTGPKIKPVDIEVHDLFRNYTPNPVYVVIDVKAKEMGTTTEAYVALEEDKEDGTCAVYTFHHVPSEIGAEEAEEIGVEHLLRDIKHANSSTLSQQVSLRVGAMKGLHSRLQDMMKYLENVLHKKLPVNNEIIGIVQDIFNLLPNLSIEEMVKAFAVKTNDMSLVIYLSSMIRSIIALHNMIDNKIENQNREQEAAAPKKEESKEGAKDKQDKDKAKATN
eukprot:TRINITY_DN24538_c0_g1_i1.p1 TRINITY_DN24538_c0_g1~~TRINITY_DN24538_c0_g1_i1.p1  ORF type:complete len:317 (+),score=99.17 TRINITY_DN24538_c0_g1_i1:216-1166(+)